MNSLFLYKKKIKAKVITLVNSIFIFDGNSLTVGQGGTPYPTQLKALTPFNIITSTFYNRGVGRQDTSQMIADAATDIDIAITSFEGARDIVNKPIEKQEMKWQSNKD